jgi:hypothetical protein
MVKFLKFLKPSFVHFFVADTPLRFIKDIFSKEGMLSLYLPLLLFGAGGLFLWRRKEAFFPFLFAAVFLLCFTYIAASIPALSFFEPLRYRAAALMFLIYPASCLCTKLFPPFYRLFRRWERFSPLLLLLPFLLYPFAKSSVFTLSLPLAEDVRGLIEWVREHTDKSARILVEDSGLLTGHKYSGGHLLALFPLLCDRYFLGGPYPYKRFLYNEVAHFYEGTLFEEKVEKINPAKLLKLLDLYNVGWVICFTPSSKKLFSTLPFMKEEARIGDFSIYKVKRKHSFFAKGEGIVHADWDGIKVKSLHTEEAVLKYHYFDVLSCFNGRIRGLPLLEKGPAFIKIEEVKEEALIR